jgi:glutathione synthase/RimK-type ligase-like ATP-grasp enzyme
MAIVTLKYQNESSMHIALISNPENRRVELFCKAVQKLGLPRPQLLSYSDILDEKIGVATFLTPSTLLRIESPGENFETEKKLIARGAKVPDNGRAKRISAADALQLIPERGRLLFLRQWFLGFSDLLASIEEDITACGCRVLNSPQSIRMMFDKLQCQQTLKNKGIPVPNLLLQPKSYDELRECLKGHPYKRVFIKPAHASSASGVMAYRMQGDREEVFTSMELVQVGGESRIYNALKIRCYTKPADIRTLFDFILNEGAIIEEWIPKASLQGKFFDVRVVVVNGIAEVILPRLSTGPITNLHLGNQRGNPEELKKFLGGAGYDRLLRCAEQAVSGVKGAYYAGVDIAITAGSHNPRVLELNAFGDLLPGIMTNNGEDIYTAELKEFSNAA